MDLNATLLGQMITFAIFVIFTMKFVWPPLVKAMEERRKKIADGLAAAERGVRELEIARHKSAEILKEAKIQAASIVDQAHKRATQTIEDAKITARNEGERLINLAKEDIEKEVLSAKSMLRTQAAHIAVTGAERILQQEIDVAANSTLLDDLISEL